MALSLAKNMKSITQIVLTALLLLSTLPDFAGAKDAEQEKDKQKVVYVGGQVTRPGVIEYRDNTTIFAMICAAGGPTQFGSLKRVKIFRDGKLFQLDLTKEKLKNTELAKPDDTIEVPQMTAQ